MQFEEKDISYPPVHPGTDRTFIRFYSGCPDLNSIYYNEDSQNQPKRIFVTDTNVASIPAIKPFIENFRAENYAIPKIQAGLIAKRSKDVLLVIGSGETFKTIESVLSICKAAIDSNAERSAIFVGIGGGVITDLTAFAASIFKRGARCELIPTTLLSMVDAAIGGKTGCDFDDYKNMIGSFFPAQKIHIIPSFIQSLLQNEYRSGLAEVVKTAMLYSSPLFEKLCANPKILTERNSTLVEEMIKICVNAKAKVVEQDLTEKNIRMHLNLGHTFGHALESRAGLGVITHGDAVAWGIVRAAELSNRLGICNHDYLEKVRNAISLFGWETSAIHPVLKGKFANDDDLAHSLLDAMKKDKKNSSSKIKFVLQSDIENTLVTEVEDKNILEVLK